MSGFFLIIQFFFVSTFLLLPVIFFGWLVGGYLGLGLIGGVGVGWILSALFRSESWISRRLNAYSSSAELNKTIRQVVETYQRSHGFTFEPSISVFPDPVPNAIAAKSLGSDGTVFLSQGLVSMLGEKDLRAVFLLMMIRLRQPGMVSVSASSAISGWFLNRMPRRWVSFVYGGSFGSKSSRSLENAAITPLSGLVFLIFFPYLWFYARLGTSAKYPSVRGTDLEAPWNVAWQKIRQYWFPESNDPALENLYLVRES